LVLGQTRKISLALWLGNSDTPGARRPLARLLDRACCAGKDGRRTLSIRGYAHDNTAHNNLLKDLYAPGIQQCGWTSMASLRLFVSAVAMVYAIYVMIAGHGKFLCSRMCAVLKCRGPSGPVFFLTCRDVWAPPSLRHSRQQPSQHCRACGWATCHSRIKTWASFLAAHSCPM
jgi:hypothetical protein